MHPATFAHEDIKRGNMKNRNTKTWIVLSLLTATATLSSYLHAFIDTDEKDEKVLYLFATPATDGLIEGGGMDAADAYCASSKPPSLSCKGGVKAFLNGQTRVAYNLPDSFSFSKDLPIYNPDKTRKIADDWADLIDGSIDVSIGDAGITSTGYWTGGDGTNYCKITSEWDSTANAGCLGDPTATSGFWFASGTDNCVQTHPALCLCWD